MSKLLIDEYPLMVLPSLAVKIGLPEAIILQQVHYWLINPSVGVWNNEHKWIHNSYREWVENFPFWSESYVKKIIKSLEEKRLLVSDQFAPNPYDHTKSYRIDYAVLGQYTSIGTGVPIEEHPSANLSETTTETTKDMETDVSVAGEEEHADKTTPKAPSIEWAILAGQPVTEDMLGTDTQRFEADVKDAAFLICQNNQHLAPLAEAFMLERKILLSVDSKKQTGHRRALKEMYNTKPNQVKPEHVRAAVKKLQADGLTVSDLWSITKTAIALANDPKAKTPGIKREPGKMFYG